MAKETTPPSDSSEELPAELTASTNTSENTSDDGGLATVDVPEEPAHFEDWNLAPPLMRALGEMGYDRPMPVQEAVFKTLTEGNDLMVQSKTGSGKTAAFGIPIAQMLSDGKKGVQALILAPTRELALQVGKEITKLVAHMDVAVVPIYGGAPIGPQIQKLEDGGQIVAGTPGRVLDHIRRGTMDTAGIRMLVLDECDEMLSMGFQEEIENIISTLPKKDERQTMLFSATIPKEIERIGRRHMREPEMLTLSSDSVGAELIDHYYYVVSGMARNRDLLKLMKAEKPDSAIIFCNTRDETNTVARYLRKNGYDAEALSSDLSQSDRERVMGRMRDKNLNFLVATDIAARGIDISELSHVINFTFPASPEVYVHRSGRTGRAGKEGTALSLVGPREIGAFYYLKLIYKIIPTERDLPNADEMAAIEEGELYEKIVAMVEGDARREHLALARRLWQSNEGERVVALLLQQLLTADKNKTTAITPAHASSGEMLVVDKKKETTDDDERPRKRRRRRREPEEASSIEASDSQDAPATSDPSEEATAEERPRRRRRRRGQEKEAVAAEAEASPDVDAPGDEEAEAHKAQAEEATTGDVVTSDVATSEAKGAEVAEAAAATEDANTSEETDDRQEASVDAQADEKPRRKRRRRGRGGDATDEAPTTEVSASDASEEDVGADTKEPKQRSTTRSKRTRKKSVKGRERKPRTEAGSHGEFWEAWAVNKQDGDADDEAGSAEAGSADDTDEKPAKRKRRRRGRKESEETQDALDESGENATRAESANDSTANDDEPSEESGPSSVRLFVNVGKREDADVDAIRTFLGEALGDNAEQLGRITLRNTHCYIRVPEDIADQVIDTCTGLVFQERDVVVERARAKR